MPHKLLYPVKEQTTWDETITERTKDDDDETAVDKREQKRLYTIEDIVSIINLSNTMDNS